MGKPVKVNGLLSMRIDVIDKSGTPVATLTSQTIEPTCVIYIENISGNTRSVRFVNTLPNGTNWMEFRGAGVRPDRWADGIPSIPDGRTRERRCALPHKSGTAKAEPIQCDEVYQALGAPPQPGSIRPWNPQTNNVPFDHEIDIDP
jgi:hypothetical protein